MEQRPQGTSLSPETLAAQALGEADPVSGGLTPAIHPSTNYEQQPDGSYRQDRVYTRADNPTYETAEGLLAALEGAGCACALFASGMAAATAIFQSLLPSDHVLVSRVLYWGVRKWLLERAARALSLVSHCGRQARMLLQDSWSLSRISARLSETVHPLWDL
jgi:cystathionine gamma-synthase